MSSDPQNIQATLQKLRDLIRFHDFLYYVEDKPEISDGEYDEYVIASSRTRWSKLKVRLPRARFNTKKTAIKIAAESNVDAVAFISLTVLNRDDSALLGLKPQTNTGCGPPPAFHSRQNAGRFLFRETRKLDFCNDGITEGRLP